jgi:hypothetical protein
MAADEERDQYLIEHLILPHDHLPDLRQDAVAHGMKSFDLFLKNFGLQLCCVRVQGALHAVVPSLDLDQ